MNSHTIDINNYNTFNKIFLRRLQLCFYITLSSSIFIFLSPLSLRSATIYFIITNQRKAFRFLLLASANSTTYSNITIAKHDFINKKLWILFEPFLNSSQQLRYLILIIFRNSRAKASHLQILFAVFKIGIYCRDAMMILLNIESPCLSIYSQSIIPMQVESIMLIDLE